MYNIIILRIKVTSHLRKHNQDKFTQYYKNLKDYARLESIAAETMRLKLLLTQFC